MKKRMSRLPSGAAPRLAVLDDPTARGDPGGVARAGAEALAPGDLVAALDGDGGGSGGRGVGDDAARRLDPDLAGEGRRDADGVGRPDAALVDAPGGAGVGLAKLLGDLDVGGEVELGAAELAWDQHVEQPGVRKLLEERPGQLTRLLDLRGGMANRGGELAGGLERRARAAVGCTHGVDRIRMGALAHPHRGRRGGSAPGARNRMRQTRPGSGHGGRSFRNPSGSGRRMFSLRCDPTSRRRRPATARTLAGMAGGQNPRRETPP